ncbi:MAG: DNA repair protein RadC [Alphaproteobacteria bacterium]|nr:DNA repair protein RadC [Alphaproteobacteria bacterium]
MTDVPAAGRPKKTEKPHHAGHRDRLRQRFLDGGTAALADYEMLELLLFHTIPRRDTKPLAKRLCSQFGGYAGVLRADAKALVAAGLSENTAVMLRAVGDAAVRLAREEVLDRPVLASWDKLLAYLRAEMTRHDTERFRILFLDIKNRLIADEEQQRGTVNHTPVYPREVVRRALELSASAIIMVHNHPSGSPEPSRADIEMTREVREAASRLGVVLHDHIIVAKGGHASFKSMGLL